MAWLYEPIKDGLRGLAVAITGWVVRPRLVVSCRVERMPIYTGVVPIGGADPVPMHEFRAVGDRPADLAFIGVFNDADRPQSDAVDVIARYSFHAADGTKLFGFPARWRDSLQVWQRGGDSRSILDRMNIHAGTTRELDLALQYVDETDAYGLNTEAQAYPDWQKPEWRLPPGDYRVEARIGMRNSIRTITAEFSLRVREGEALEMRQGL
jgi:hypothetical protein